MNGLLGISDKIIFIDQTFIFKKEILPIHFENIGSVAMKTQWLGMFNFGQLFLHLKEGELGDELSKIYVPKVAKVAETLSRGITMYQRGQYTIEVPKDRPFVSTAEVNSKLETMNEKFETIVKPQYEEQKKSILPK